MEGASIYQKYVKPKLESNENYRNEFYARRQHRVKKINNLRYETDDKFREMKKQKALERYYKNKDKSNNRNLERYHEMKAIKFFSSLFD